MFGSLLCVVGGALILDQVIGFCNNSNSKEEKLCKIKNKYNNYTTSELDVKFRENGYSEYIGNSREYKIEKANELWGDC